MEWQQEKEEARGRWRRKKGGWRIDKKLKRRSTDGGETDLCRDLRDKETEIKKNKDILS